MKWILCGKNDVAIAALQRLAEAGEEVWALGTRGDDGSDGWQASFRGAAERLGVPFEQPRRINDPAFVERLAAFGADRLISIQYDQILRGELFRRVGCPCVNLHFALLPRHRGVAPIAWAILAGDDEAGVTLHHMVEDIDAGDVIARKAVPIGPGDSAREIYDRVSAAGRALFEESFPFSDALLATRLVQDHSTASYHRNGDFDFSRTGIDWTRPADELQRWLRALIFPPLQFPETSLGRRRFRVEGVAPGLGPPAEAAPGSVIGHNEGGIDVAAADGSIRIAAIRDTASPETPHCEIARSLAVGDRFAPETP